MKNLYTSIILLLCSFSIIEAQTVIKGSLLDEEGESISFANVLLNSATDSSMVKVETSGVEGEFSFLGVEKGAYFVSVSFVGKAEYSSDVIQFDPSESIDLGTITLKPSSTDLTEVTVSAVRPILEVKPDKIVFNVEGSINAQGNDGLELLRKAPGVVIDNNDNVSLAGKSNVRIFIDGKPSPLGGEDLANYLRSINSSEIDNIEIITNPSAKYEAEGNAGIINIRMKKDQRLGANATVNLGYGVGFVHRYNGGITANYKNKISNIFGSYNYSGGDMYWRMESYREQYGVIIDAESLTQGPRNSHNFKAGTDFFLNDKNTLGFLVSGNIAPFQRTSNSINELSTVGVEGIDSLLVSETTNEGQNMNYLFNINYKYDIAKDKTLNVDLDYGVFQNRREEYQPNIYQSTDGAVLSERIFRTESPTNIDIYTFKLDYEQPLWKGKLGTGIKSSLVVTDNIFDYFNVNNNISTIDTDRSSQFDYEENVNAAYITYSKQVKKFNLSGGVRMEQTNTKGTLMTYVPANDPEPTVRHYVDFFPSAGVSYSPNMKHTLQLNYSRRLDRPNYQNLNPFEYKINELSFRKGNPFLRPQYTNNVQLSHTFKFRYTTSFSFSHTNDLMTRIIDYADNGSGSHASFLTWVNISEQYNYSLSFSAPVSVTKWWSSYSNLTAFRTNNKAVQNDEINDIDITVNALRLYSQHTFSLPWDLKFELSGWYASPSLWGGIFETDYSMSIDAGIQKRILNDKGNIKLSVSDIFKTAPWSGRSEYAGVVSTANGDWDTRRFKINFSYFFGNDKVKSRKRKTGLEDEKGRTGGGDGGGQ